MIEMVLQRIREYSNAVKKRDVKIDALRGLAVFCVMMTHAGITGGLNAIISTIMIPLFLFVTGYLWRQGDFGNLLHRIGWLFISWIVISYVQAIVNVETIVGIVNNPRLFISIVNERTILMLQGEAVWYLPAIMVLSIIIWIFLTLCSKLRCEKLILPISFAIALFASNHFVVQGQNCYWYLDWAIVNQVFVVLGITLRKNEEMINHVARLLCVVLYCTSVTILIIFFDFDGFNVRRNEYANVVLYFLIAMLAVLSCFFIIELINYRLQFLAYLGRHSILLFAFGPHGYFVGKKVINEFGFNLAPNAKAIIISISACILWIVPAIAVDLFLPILNGQKRKIGY